MEAQYIVLEYCPNLTSQKSRTVAVVAMQRIEASEAPLILIRDAGWEQGSWKKIRSTSRLCSTT